MQGLPDLAPPSDQVEFAHGVTPCSLGRIQPTRRNKLRYPVRGHPDDPFLLMNLSVMMSTKEETILQAGSPEVSVPEVDVVRICPVGWAVASGPAATVVPGGDRPADVGGEGAGGPSDV